MASEKVLGHEFVPHPKGPDHYTGCTQFVEGRYCGQSRAAHHTPCSVCGRLTSGCCTVKVDAPPATAGSGETNREIAEHFLAALDSAQREAFAAGKAEGMEAAAKVVDADVMHLESIELTEFGSGGLSAGRCLARAIRALAAPAASEKGESDAE